MVQQVRDLYSRNTVVVEALLETMGLIASSACSVLAEMKKNEQNSLGELYVTEFKKLEVCFILYFFYRYLLQK